MPVFWAVRLIHGSLVRASRTAPFSAIRTPLLVTIVVASYSTRRDGTVIVSESPSLPGQERMIIYWVEATSGDATGGTSSLIISACGSCFAVKSGEIDDLWLSAIAKTS